LPEASASWDRGGGNNDEPGDNSADRGAVRLRKRDCAQVDRLAREEVLREVKGGKTANDGTRSPVRQDAIRQRYRLRDWRTLGTARDDRSRDRSVNSSGHARGQTSGTR
jgi:hypothetical protein